eukprot:scaffold1973_cov399-Prasinococcus_capsulatus_cf.AAC.9
MSYTRRLPTPTAGHSCQDVALRRDICRLPLCLRAGAFVPGSEPRGGSRPRGRPRRPSEGEAAQAMATSARRCRET